MSKSIECPDCGHDGNTVMQSWKSDEFGGSFRRRRKCKNCNALFHTAELDVVILEIFGVKK